MMNVNEYVRVNGENDDSYDDGVYELLTKLSRHTLQSYRPVYRNVQFTYDHDINVIKRLRTKAFEILLKKSDSLVPSQDYRELEEVDPFIEIQKYIFALKLRSRHSCNVSTLEHLLQELEESPSTEIPIYPVLQLLLQLKSFNVNPELMTDIFYCGKSNPALPEVIQSTNDVPPFQVYPIECFISPDKFEARLETQRFQITRTRPVNIINGLDFLQNSVTFKPMIGFESTEMPVACNLMSNHVFDKISLHTLLCQDQHSTMNTEFNLYISQNNMIEDKYDNIYSFPLDKAVALNCLCLPFIQSNTEENRSITDTWKIIDQSVTNESNSITNIWNNVWDQIDVTNNTTTLDHQTWEYLGEIQSVKEPMFITETPVAAIHLERIKEMNNLPLLSEKILNSVLLLEEVSAKEFINDVKSMLLGIESKSFQYRYGGFVLRENISVYGVCTESLQNICQEPINWGNYFKFLLNLVTPKSQSSKLPQEGLIFKAMCTNIKELLLYYQAAILRIFTYENDSDRLLKILQRVRPVTTLISKIAKVCEPYKESECINREGNSILTRIYNEAIKVTDTKIALVFYSLLKSCCEIYFRFLQKWLFEGICDDVYGEFMIKTRPQYLRNRSHKFWTRSFSICNDAVPGFLSDLAESILQCGKTVRLLRTCDSKNPVCNVCVTEQPEIRVCLSAIAIHEQTIRCQEYERKGESALGSILSLSTAVLNQKRLEKQMSEIVVHNQGDVSLRHREEKGGHKRELKTVIPSDSQKKNKEKEKDIESSNKVVLQIEDTKEECVIKERSRYVERTNILNYYESLANDINKRCIRSQWRVKRMKFYDKRVDALCAANLESRDQLKRAAELNCLMTPDPSVGTPSSFQDENKNYTETSLQSFILDLTKKAEIDQQDSTQDPYLLTNQSHKKKISNDNEKSEIPPNQNTETTVQLNEILQNLTIRSTHRNSVTIQRPTFLNVAKIDNATTETLSCNMTPNNNEVNIQQITFIPLTNEVTGTAILVENNTIISNRRNDDLETPMSCATDNFTTSSVHSPVSQTYSLENSCPTENSSAVTPFGYSQLISKSSLNMKKDSTFSDLFELAHDERSSSVSPVTTPLSINDVEIIDHISLQAYLEKSIRIPLNVQSRLVNNTVIKYFLKENKLLSHLHSLRSYFFLLNGEFAKSLTDSLYARLYEISIPIELFNSVTLTNLLERALVHSFNNVYVNSELLSLSATDIPAQLHISDPTALDCLSLNYKINWPLNIILDGTVMQQYCKVFKFLITSGRVSWVLQEDFNIMKRERKAVTSEQYHKLQLYRHSMTQFMNALHNYLTCSVLHASWAEFEKDLEHSLTVDQIYLSHVNYLRRILSRCMLNSRGEKVRVCLNNIFKVILKFHNRIRSQNWVMRSTRYVHPNFKKLEQMYRAFCELRAYMAHVAFKLATSGYQPHLMHFLNTLNINHVYDLTVKTSRSSASAPEL
ncbi:gamma-tubulin complex component 6 isoform X2 [Xylocopa sonorina]|uniref:gamma-tubulin complex component 6 isoform X2 n=1 Tax=Xylocopa sonorina TaxID=1818115 RepID=UPI00403A85E9